MLETGSKERLTSYLTSTVTATDTNFVATGLEIFLAGANSAYHFDFGAVSTWDTDGIRYRISYSGTLANNKFIASKADGSVAQGTVGTAVSELTTPSTEVFSAQGVITTTSPGRLYVEIAKGFDLGVDSDIRAGSFLVARALA